MEEKILELVDMYIVYPKEDVKTLINSSSRVEYATRGLGYLEGYYCPRRIELFVSNCKRGRLIKRPKKNFDGYKYYYSDDNEICMVDTFCSRELIIRKDDYVYGIYYHKFWQSETYILSYITAAHYESNLLRSYSQYKIGPCDLGRDMSAKDNICVYADYDEYLYSTETTSSIKTVITGRRFYNSSDRIDKVISNSKIDLDLHKNSETDTKQKTDNQKKLCGKLKLKINTINSLDQAIKAFFEVVSDAAPNDEEMLLYEVGCYPAVDNSQACLFCLVRQTPSEDGEYYQMHLELQYEVNPKTNFLKECIWHEKGNGNLLDQIYESDAFRILKEEPIVKINVWVDET